jgi:tartrate-resistant acid phosphatase type 5
MGIIADILDIDFVVSTEDNFYNEGLTGIDDPAFDESFKYVYGAHSLQKPWYTCSYINIYHLVYWLNYMCKLIF